MRIAVAGGTGVVGRHVVEALEASGHDPVILSRSTGVDLMTGVGLAASVAGVDAVVDVTSVATTSATKSVRFFRTVTMRLLAAEQTAGVPHHVALSIVGAAQIDAAYFAGKKVQEELVMASANGWTIVRATQFHEFARQILPLGAVGPLQVVPRMVSQPVAAVEVGTARAWLATNAPSGLAADLAGPQVERMANLSRRYLRAIGSSRPVLEVPLPGPWGRGMRNGSLLPGPGAQLGKQTFDDWLGSI
jgi:uncharacterized protein YbjT (DUF2867 family)